MSNASLVVVDVGHGNCSVLREGDSVAVVDCAKRNVLLEYLEKEEIRDINTIVISHADEDHLAGLVGLLGSDQYKIGTIFINTDAVKDTRIWDDVKHTLNNKFHGGNIDVQSGVKAGPISTWKGEKTKMEIVSPSLALQLTGAGGKLNSRRVTTNTMSIVVRIHYDDEPIVILAGDMDQISLDDVKKNKKDITAKFLVYPHHGGHAGGTTDVTNFALQLLDEVKPTATLFSNGRGRFDNPQPQVVNAVKSFGGCSIACTQLSSTCSAQLSNAPRNGLSSKYAAGAKQGACCAGSMEIDLTTGEILAPDWATHVEFVRSLPSALCMR